MTRISGTTLAEAQSAVIAPLLLVQLGITGGTGNYNFTSHDADITVGGVAYTRTAIKVGAIQERDDARVTMRTVSLSINEQDLATVMQTRANYINKSAKIMDALLLVDGSVLIAATWVGIIAGKSFKRTHGGQSLVITCQDWAAILARKGWARFSDVTQQQRSPGDSFFANMPALKNRHVVWMGATRGGGVGGGGGGGSVKITMPDGSIKWT